MSDDINALVKSLGKFKKYVSDCDKESIENNNFFNFILSLCTKKLVKPIKIKMFLVIHASVVH